MIEVIEKYKFTNENNFNFKITDKDKEKLKIVFDKEVKDYLNKPEMKEKLRDILSQIDFELTVD